jgi:hypothetical protein
MPTAGAVIPLLGWIRAGILAGPVTKIGVRAHVHLANAEIEEDGSRDDGHACDTNVKTDITFLQVTYYPRG